MKSPIVSMRMIEWKTLKIVIRGRRKASDDDNPHLGWRW